MNPSTSNAAAARPTLRDKLAQLIFIRIGSNLPPVRTVGEDEERVARLLETTPVGGLVVFNGSYAETPRTLERLQGINRFPLLVGSDLERGAGQQLRGLPLAPHAMAFDALGSEAAEAVGQFAELTARAARAAGVHALFAPVADVNSDPRNPIIATRAFGTEPARVAELVAAFVAGCRRGGGLATAKHFPGHGDTHEDSHHALPAVNAPGDVMRARELAPFRAAIAAGAPLIMTAHVRYPALDPGGAAATFSRPILTDLLRRELGFQGAVASDSLLMEGAKMGFGGPGELAAAALAAGVDLLLDVADPAETLDGLEAAVGAGRLEQARIDEALSRKRRLHELTLVEGPAGFDAAKTSSATLELAATVARRAVRVVTCEPGALPLRPEASLCAVLVNPFPLPTGADRPVLGAALRARFPRVQYHELGAEPSDAQLQEIARQATAAEQFLAAIVVKPAAWHRFGLPPQLAEWLAELAARRSTVVACLGAPQGLEPFAGANALMCTMSDVPVSQQALVDALVRGS